jgi:putative transposase
MAKPLEHYGARSSNRDKAIALAYDSGSYGMKEIGEHFGLHYSRVSRIISGQRKAKDKS